MKDDILIIGNVLTYIFTSVQANEVFQVIQLIFSILTSIVLCIFKLIEWYKKAKEDGKITKEELKEGEEIIKDLNDKLK